MYKRALKLVYSVLGNGETTGGQLDTVGKHVFEHKWNGVRARDELSDLQNGYYIANLDKSNQPGSHWTALAVEPHVIYYFDSFARPNESTLKVHDPVRFVVQEANPDILQPEDSDSCGQRCLAWLLTYENDPRDALSI